MLDLLQGRKFHIFHGLEFLKIQVVKNQNPNIKRFGSSKIQVEKRQNQNQTRMEFSKIQVEKTEIQTEQTRLEFLKIQVEKKPKFKFNRVGIFGNSG